jgi:dATP pyrophosphohydrolase
VPPQPLLLSRRPRQNDDSDGEAQAKRGVSEAMARAPFQVLVLPFRRGSQVRYAIFRRADDRQWQGIAGGGESGETPLAAARRELAEESGLAGPLYRLDCRDTVPANCFAAAWPTWPADTYVVEQHFFAVDVGEQEVTLSREHTEYAWLPYYDADQLLRYDSNRTALWELDLRIARDELGPAREVG